MKGAADILRAGSEEDNKEEEDDNNLGIKAGPGPGRVKAFFPIVQLHVNSESCFTCFSFLVQKLPLITGHIGLPM